MFFFNKDEDYTKYYSSMTLAKYIKAILYFNDQYQKQT